MVGRIITSLVDWQETSYGRQLYGLEQNHLRDFIQSTHADRVLQISGMPLLNHHEVPHYVMLEDADDVLVNSSVPTVRASIHTKLPFRDDSFEVVVLNHTHERVHSLSTLLNEVERILLPEGKLVVYGIRSTSLWAIALLFKLYYVPCCRRVYSEFLLKQHMINVGLEIVATKKQSIIQHGWRPSVMSMSAHAHHVLIGKKVLSGLVLGASL